MTAKITSKILKNSREIRKEIENLFSDPTRKRVACVAFVGGGVDEYLRKPKGLELYCWNKVGGTDPDAIRDLREAGAKVWFVNNLHMKLYWAEGKGAIIGSANLSDNGLSGSGLHEMAVLLPSTAINIEQIKHSLDATLVTPNMLQDFSNRTRKYRSRNEGKLFQPESRKRGKRPSPPKDFAEWYKSEYGDRWRLYIYYAHFTGTPKPVKDELKELGYKKAAWLWLGSESEVPESEWVLKIGFEDADQEFAWTCAERAVKLTRKDKGFYSQSTPYCGVQLHDSHYYGKAPFDVRAKAFKQSLYRFLENIKTDKGKKQMDSLSGRVLTKRELKPLYDLYVKEKKTH